jgi:hypothetical protein
MQRYLFLFLFILLSNNTIKAQDSLTYKISIDTNGNVQGMLGDFYGTVCIEAYLYNRWIMRDSFQLYALNNEQFFFRIIDVYQGENQFRVSLFVEGIKENPIYKKLIKTKCFLETRYDSCAKSVRVCPPAGNIPLTCSVYWEIVDQNGTRIRSEYSDRIDMTGLNKGTYRLNFANKTADFYVQ